VIPVAQVWLPESETVMVSLLLELKPPETIATSSELAGGLNEAVTTDPTLVLVVGGVGVDASSRIATSHVLATAALDARNEYVKSLCYRNCGNRHCVQPIVIRNDPFSVDLYAVTSGTPHKSHRDGEYIESVAVRVNCYQFSTGAKKLLAVRSRK
jgi:hypothetical protein